MTTTWELIATDTYVSANWTYAIERVGDEWRVSVRGEWKRSLPSLEMAQAWADGKVIR